MRKVKNAAKERRNWVRVKRILSIEYRLAKTKRRGANKDWHLSITQDMSAGGISFYTELDFKETEILDIRVVMSGILDVFKGQVKIVRIERKKTGSHYLVAVAFKEKNLK